MFYHVVMFKLKDNSNENMDKVKELLLSMDGKIPELKKITVGKDTLFTGRSFDICLITQFESKEDMDIYQDSYYHVEYVLKNLKPQIEKSAACDFIA